MTDDAVQCERLSKSFGDQPAVRGVSLALAQHTILAVLGPSGCGKTTLLRLIAGFDRPDAGRVRVGSVTVCDLACFIPPERRAVGMVFQDYALFPHLSVERNIAYGLKRFDRQRVGELLELVGLAPLARRMPHELSGGEQQRVALARALAPQPEVLLLDEPFSNLDADRRGRVRREVREILRQTGTSALLVTHDQEEAFQLGDRIAVMNAGVIEQVGTPDDVFHRPTSRFVASFLGLADLVPGQRSGRRVETAFGPVETLDDIAVQGEVLVVARPDDWELVDDEPRNAEIVSRAFQGSRLLYEVRGRDGQRIRVRAPHTRVFDDGTTIGLRLNPGHPLVCFPAG